MKVIIKVKGGPGSGNFDHAGIPGHRGGSAPAKGTSPEDIRQGVLKVYQEYSAALQNIFQQHKEIDARMKDKLAEKATLESQKRGKTTKAYRQVELEIYDLTDERAKLDSAENDAFDAYLEKSHALMRVDNPIQLDLTDYTSEGYDMYRVDRAQQFVNSITAVIPMHPVELRDLPAGYRANYDSVTNTMKICSSDGAAAIVHELGHYLEYTVPKLFEKVTGFYSQRTQGQAAQSLASLMPGKGFKPGEVTRPDSFIHPYMGKQYEDGHGEILSMGMEMLYKDPAGFAENDPEYFNFILGLLHGE